MNPLEQQLKRLCEVDPGHFRAHKRDSDVSWAVTFKPGLAFWFDEDGQLQGGEALWFMLSEMQARLQFLEQKPLTGYCLKDGALCATPGAALTDTEAAEREILEVECDWMLIDAELTLSTYIQWKEAVK